MNTVLPPALGSDANGCNLWSVVILISHGENGAGAYLPSGGRHALPTSAPEIENVNDDQFFVKGETSTGGANVFDDLVFAWSPDQLLEPLYKQGTVRSATVMSHELLRNTAIAISNEIVKLAQEQTTPPTATSYTIPAAPERSNAPNPPTAFVLPSDVWGNLLVYDASAGFGSQGIDLCNHTALPSGSTTPVFTLIWVGIDGARGTFPPTGRDDDYRITVFADPLRQQINLKPGGYSC
jgi:hypothetical protein